MSSLKKTLIKGTLLLTIASLLTKVLGFYNRIFLSQTIGAREIGVYQLIFPVYLIVHSLCCQGFEYGIMKFVAQEAARGNRRNVWRYFKICALGSLSLAVLCMVFVYLNCDFIAVHLLKQADCAPCLKILTAAFPLLSIKDSILAYFYAMKKTALPAGAQLLEQIVRVTVIWGISTFVLTITKDASLATMGLVAGEAASLLLVLFFVPSMKREINHLGARSQTVLPRRTIVKHIFSYCTALTSSRLLLTVLSSVESVLVPYLLAKALANEDEALSLFGILTGMSLTFITFPSALTNSIATMLLPAVSEAQAQNQQRRIKRAASLSLHYCLLLGILSTTVFLVFGKDLGNLVFHEPAAGEYIFILSWLCPFIYVATTLTSILNGLGKTTLTFTNNVISVLIRIFCIVALVPRFHMQGYLIGLLVSYSTLAILCYHHLHKEAGLQMTSRRSILTPALLSVLATTFALLCEFLLIKINAGISLVILSICIGILCLIYGLGCLFLQLIKI